WSSCMRRSSKAEWERKSRLGFNKPRSSTLIAQSYGWLRHSRQYLPARRLKSAFSRAKIKSWPPFAKPYAQNNVPGAWCGCPYEYRKDHGISPARQYPYECQRSRLRRLRNRLRENFSCSGEETIE